MNECLWWIKRHTVDKELLLHEASGHSDIYNNREVSNALENYFAGNANKNEKKCIEDLLVKAELTVSDLWILGFKDASKHLKMADELIHRQYQTMRHLQRSIDSVDFKSRLIKRMDLELSDLESKAQAINVKPS